jgi:hypothetical protein
MPSALFAPRRPALSVALDLCLGLARERAHNVGEGALMAVIF